MEYGRKPLTAITRQLNKPIRVTLKNDICYEGMMVECDSYMNLVIEKATEFMGDSWRAGYDKVLIRGNNVLYVQLSVLTPS